MHRHGIVVFAASCFLTAVPLFAQNEPPRTDREPRATDPRPTSMVTAPSADEALVAWLVVDNENEIALAKVAEERSQNADVKQFAKKMVDDHGRMLSKLQRFASAGDAAGMPRTTEPDTRDPKGKTDSPRQPQSPEERPRSEGEPRLQDDRRGTAPRTGPGLDVIALKRDLGRKCLESAKRELEQKSGAEFDKCYMHQQVMAHVVVVDTLEVFQNHASGELKNALAEALPTVRQHLQHAKDLATKVDGGQDTPSEPDRSR